MADPIATPTSAPAADAPPTAPAAPDALPGWLQQLATESWQVELLVSGFAIVGTAQLTDFLEPLAGYALFTFRADVLSYVSIAFSYLTLGFVLLPVLFAAHFAVRAFWVGMVGLASVYPGGIGPERGSLMPEVYVDHVRASYPPLSTWIARTESVASLMFIVAALVAMLFVGTAVSLSGLVLVAALVEFVSGGAIPFRTTTIVLLTVVFAIVCTSMLMQSPALRDRPWVKRVYLRGQFALQSVLYHVFGHPLTYLSTVLLTNLRMPRPFATLAAGIGLVLLGFFLHRDGPLTSALRRTSDLREEAKLADRYDPARYRSTWPDEDFVALVPYVERERVGAGELIEVTVPILGEDRYRIADRRPPAPPHRADTTRAARLATKRAGMLAAHRDYYRFRVDTVVLSSEELVDYEADDAERGVRTLVRLPPKLPAGRQVLWVDRRATEGPDFTPAAAIPLIIEGE